MRKILSFYLLLAVFVINSGAGCGGRTTDEPESSAQAFLRMKINGKTWAATGKISGVAGKVPGIATQGIISFSGDSGKDNLTVNIYGTTSPGTYTILPQNANNSVAALSLSDGSVNGNYLSTKAPGSSLTVKVTQASDTRVSGTFSGTLNLEYALGTGTAGPTTVTITDGEFSTID
ncbi:hypothetical protein [Larkinella rosea]|uniref:DUF4251 domain-containing protein n=1 Tax=Larkinella rosea TaxID=2025312 RepID=A0A3P1BZW2_9BACT|nr:hypothetical protein [Larkinella rosea]RRB06695.1 hypothetical protein EHT25_02560 [Larkinella rosea]